MPTLNVASALPLLGSAEWMSFGDSISALGIFQPERIPAAFPIAAWAASTAYVVGDIRKNGTSVYRCITAGTSASSGGPLTLSSDITDGTAHWATMYPQHRQPIYTYQFWVDAFARGRVRHAYECGYLGTDAGALKVNVIAGGSGYVAPTISWSSGGTTGTVQMSGGVITGVTITNPGYLNPSVQPVIADGSGTGAIVRQVIGGSGTFGVGGDDTYGMVARLADVLASGVATIAILGGINDIVTYGTSAANVIANLKTIYDTLLKAGRAVVAVPILPRASLTTAQAVAIATVNRWIRAYCGGEVWANTLRLRGARLADPSPYIGNPTSAVYAAQTGMLTDGTHPGIAGAMWLGAAIWGAIQGIIGPANVTSPKHSCPDGVEATLNPRGNLIEGYPWRASTAFIVGDLCSNGGNVYYCSTAGTSASSGGPSGTTTASDGTVTWTYVRPVGLSVGVNSTGGTNTAAGGIAFTGTPPAGTTMARSSGTASGTVTESIETSRTDGLPGARPVFDFSLGSGGATEIWGWTVSTGAYGKLGIHAADRGAKSIRLEVEIEVTAAVNLIGLDAILIDTSSPIIPALVGTRSPSEAGSAPDPAVWPSKVIRLVSSPIEIPNSMAQLDFSLRASFNTSGGAASATATIKVNYLNLVMS